MSFPVSVSVHQQPIVSGIGRQNGIGLTLSVMFTSVHATAAGVLYMKNMVMQYWEESDEAKPSDPPAFVIHENDKQVIRDHIVEAVIAASNPIRSAFYRG